MSSAFLLLPLVALSFAKIIDVQVGQDNLTFTPEAIAADVGDQIVFHYHPKNHSVTQSSFAAPCGPNPSGFDSGFMPVAANDTNLPTFTITVNDTKPIWVYCAQAANTVNSHCGAGMVFAANCGADGAPNSFTNFKASALKIGQGIKDAVAAASAAGSTTVDGSITIPAAPSATLVTSTISLSTSTWTTTYSSYPGSPAPTPASLSGGTVHKVTVGDGAFAFNPPMVAAAIGDIVQFEFHPKNHTVTQSSFAAPCVPLNANGTTGFDSGFMPVNATTTDFPTWNLTVNTTSPIWAFCGQIGHCGDGMVFAINSVESSPRNFSAFQALAMQINGTTSGAISGNTTSGNTTSQSSPPPSGAMSVSYAHVGLLSLVLSVSVMLL